MRPILPLLALLPALVAMPAMAQRSYDVEIVVFEHLDSEVTERWRPEVVLPRLADAAAFDPDGPRADRLRDLPDGFERLSTEDSELADAARRLRDADAYRVLRHSAWRQPALGADEAVALRFEAGEPVSVRLPATAFPPALDETGPEAGMDAEANDEDDGRAVRVVPSEPDDAEIYMVDTPFGMGMLAAPRREAEVLPLDGTVKLVVSRYLHLHTDLYYTAAVEWDEDDGGTEAETANGAMATEIGAAARRTTGPDGEPMLSYGMRQERRMRSGELHYLDHPVLGVLVKVTPYEPDTGT